MTRFVRTKIPMSFQSENVVNMLQRVQRWKGPTMMTLYGRQNFKHRCYDPGHISKSLTRSHLRKFSCNSIFLAGHSLQPFLPFLVGDDPQSQQGKQRRYKLEIKALRKLSSQHGVNTKTGQFTQFNPEFDYKRMIN